MTESCLIKREESMFWEHCVYVVRNRETSAVRLCQPCLGTGSFTLNHCVQGLCALVFPFQRRHGAHWDIGISATWYRRGLHATAQSSIPYNASVVLSE